MYRFLPALLILSACGSAPEPPRDPQSSIQKVNVFEGETGGYAHYRVPAIAVSPNGTVMAMAEARKSSGGDWGTQNILMRRSHDGGQTWDEPRQIARVDGEIQQNEVAFAQDLAKPGEVTYNNIVPIVDKELGLMHFLFCVEYARAYYIRSDDDGETFSTPVDITATFEEFKTEYGWKVIATGPGHGIKHSNGRLIVPVWLSDGTGGHAHRPSIVSTIYSDDDGVTWNRGEVVVSHPDLKNPSETLAVELSDGSVMLNIRHESPQHRRAISVSPDGATGWSEIRFDEALVEPICMGSLIRSGALLLFVNPDSTEPRSAENPLGSWVRQNVSVQLSDDDGKTWPHKRVIEPGVSGYSDLAVGPDGAIYCVYENGTPRDRGTHVKYLTVAKFDANWVRASCPIQDEPEGEGDSNTR